MTDLCDDRRICSIDCPIIFYIEKCPYKSKPKTSTISTATALGIHASRGATWCDQPVPSGTLIPGPCYGYFVTIYLPIKYISKNSLYLRHWKVFNNDKGVSHFESFERKLED